MTASRAIAVKFNSIKASPGYSGAAYHFLAEGLPNSRKSLKFNVLVAISRRLWIFTITDVKFFRIYKRPTHEIS
ncbi:MAG: hypothetical protein CMQ14_11830 [Gammaproteobacteria bacterium]|nr:hypothetical protein [Gammaproteobacteria bacterium]